MAVNMVYTDRVHCSQVLVLLMRLR